MLGLSLDVPRVDTQAHPGTVVPGCLPHPESGPGSLRRPRDSF